MMLFLVKWMQSINSGSSQIIFLFSGSRRILILFYYRKKNLKTQLCLKLIKIGFKIICKKNQLINNFFLLLLLCLPEYSIRKKFVIQFAYLLWFGLIQKRKEKPLIIRRNSYIIKHNKTIKFVVFCLLQSLQWEN